MNDSRLPADTSLTTALQANDVLMDQSGSNAYYIGNVRFSLLVQSQKAAYQAAATTPACRDIIVERLYHEICHERQGRFLAEQPRVRGVICTWRIVDNKQAVVQILHQNLGAPSSRAVGTILPTRATTADVGLEAVPSRVQASQATQELRRPAHASPLQLLGSDLFRTVPVPSYTSSDPPRHAVSVPPSRTVAPSRDHSTSTLQLLLDHQARQNNPHDLLLGVHEATGSVPSTVPPNGGDPSSLETPLDRHN